MPKITPPKESLEQKPVLPPGDYEFMLKGFKPKHSKNKNSVNMQPEMVVINHPTANGSRIFDNLNSNAGWVQKDFCHALGVPMVDSFPGEFDGPEDKPEDWKYIDDPQMPLTGKTGRVQIENVSKKDANGNTVAGLNAAIKKYYCAVPGCTEKHTESLL